MKTLLAIKNDGTKRLLNCDCVITESADRSVLKLKVIHQEVHTK